MTAVAFGFVGFDPGNGGSEIDDVHPSAATRLETGEWFMLEGLDESAMLLSFVLR
jgi:hypothetical protein